jgi:hypothetical protein
MIMAEIANLQELFAAAAADWTFSPPPLFRSGLVGRIISVAATVTAQVYPVYGGAPVYEPGFNATLNYLPARTRYTPEGPISLPPYFYGTGGNGAYLNIDAPFIESEGYGTYLTLPHGLPADLPLTWSFSTPPPGGTFDPGLADPTAAIVYQGGATGEGWNGDFKVLIYDYNFVLWFKRGGRYGGG